MNRIVPLEHLLLLSLISILIFTATYTRGQSTDGTRPTPIAAFPVSGNLGSGTYYYQVPESLVSAGTANALLDFTPPVGGASMTVTFSGRSCCPPEAYMGVTTGLADPMHETARFNIPSRQPILVTVYVSVAATQTVPFRLTLTIGPGSGIIVTPPPTPTPSPTPTTTAPPRGTCTDLTIRSFSVSEETGVRREIRGNVMNLSTTAYSGYARMQWVEVRDITVSAVKPTLVGKQMFAAVPGGGATPFSVEHILTTAGRRRYEVAIVYSRSNATDSRNANDDCNSSNDSTRLQDLGILRERE